MVLAFSMLALFIGPLLDAPFSHLRKQIQQISSIQLSLEAQKCLFSIQEKMLKDEIPWKKLEQAEKSPVFLEKKTITPFHLSHSNTPLYEAEVYLSKAHLEKKEDLSSYGWVRATVIFSPISSHTKEKKQKFSSVFFVSRSHKNS